MLVVIGTDGTGSSKSNYHTITATLAPNLVLYIDLAQTYSLLKPLFNPIHIFCLRCRPPCLAFSITVDTKLSSAVLDMLTSSILSFLHAYLADGQSTYLKGVKL